MLIVEFLEMRLADDEAPAVAMIEGSHDKWPANDFDGPKQDEEYLALHIGAGRVLREVAAKRAILDVAHRWWKYGNEQEDQDGFDVLRHLASTYQDHPDFDPAWAVEAAAVR